MGQNSLKAHETIDLSQWIPLFPLPNAVLMPRAILPLHIFEERYRVMTRDALSGSRLIALALLMPGYESEYHTLHAQIHPTVCVGRILREERLADGRYNFLLQGLARARVKREKAEGKYRRALVEVIANEPPPPEVELAYRRELRRLLREPQLRELAYPAGWLDLMQCPDISLSEVVDVLAASLLQCPEDKQQFLCEARVGARARRLCAILEEIVTEMQKQDGPARWAREWPPACLEN